MWQWQKLSLRKACREEEEKEEDEGQGGTQWGGTACGGRGGQEVSK